MCVEIVQVLVKLAALGMPAEPIERGGERPLSGPDQGAAAHRSDMHLTEGGPGKGEGACSRPPGAQECGSSSSSSSSSASSSPLSEGAGKATHLSTGSPRRTMMWDPELAGGGAYRGRSGGDGGSSAKAPPWIQLPPTNPPQRPPLQPPPTFSWPFSPSTNHEANSSKSSKGPSSRPDLRLGGGGASSAASGSTSGGGGARFYGGVLDGTGGASGDNGGRHGGPEGTPLGNSGNVRDGGDDDYGKGKGDGDGDGDDDGDGANSVGGGGLRTRLAALAMAQATERRALMATQVLLSTSPRECIRRGVKRSGPSSY